MGKKRMIIIGTGEYADRVQGYARTLITCEVIRFSKYQIYGTPECYTDYIATNTFFVVAFEDNKENNLGYFSFFMLFRIIVYPKILLLLPCRF